MADLTSGMLAFSALLRTEYDIDAGHARAYEALRALEIVGIRDLEHARYALRLVFCSKADEIARFDRAFDVFFSSEERGVRQPRAKTQSGSEGADAPPASRREPQNEKLPADAWRAMQARYSPAASETHESPSVPDAGLAETLADAGRLIASLRLGRSRRWKPHVRGRRFDLRRTLRASLQTGGDPARIRTLGHPLRNPRIVVLLDASRSMSEYAEGLLQFAYALCQRSQRTRVFAFSTALRDITRDLRGMTRTGERRLHSLGAAWGGGTRIGACMLEFVRKYGSHLDADTLAIVASDGLDVGDVAHVTHAMRQIYRRCAGVVWLNPHAGESGFVPAAAGMKAALPYVSALLDAKDLKAIGAAARHLRR
jgi:uncharacterized protein with von Willebrand factor type A (vWA) domain